jgi:hypothetical protein
MKEKNMDQPQRKIRWLLKPQETFRVRFAVLEPENDRVRVTVDEDRQGIQHWAEFLMWDYAKMIELRKKSTKYQNETRTFYVDNDMLNELKLKHLLKSWSFGEVDPYLKLHHTDGVLTDESWQFIKAMYPCIVQAMIERMNAVLEGYM